MIEDQTEKKQFYDALYFPVLLLMIIWVIKGIEIFFGMSLVSFGIYPRELFGLKGILFAPLIHADFNHLINNSVPFFFLNLAIFYFYKPVALRVVAFIWIITGILVWIAARGAYHIGASSLIYGNASFLFFSGILKRNINLLAMSLLIIFLYGGMVWGIFPINLEISWESHLFGGITGMVFAFLYADKGPEPEKKEWEDDEDDDLFPYWDVRKQESGDRSDEIDEGNQIKN